MTQNPAPPSANDLFAQQVQRMNQMASFRPGEVRALLPEEAAALQNIPAVEVPNLAAAQQQAATAAAMPPSLNAAGIVQTQLGDFNPSVLGAMAAAADRAPLMASDHKVVHLDKLPQADRDAYMAEIAQVQARYGTAPTPPPAPAPGTFVQGDFKPSVMSAVAQMTGAAPAETLQMPGTPPSSQQTDQQQTDGSDLKTAAPADKRCVNCGWNDPDPMSVLELKDVDKVNFIAMFTGGSHYTHDFPFFDGKLVITFRNLTVAEQNMALRQAAVDQINEKFDSSLEYVRMSANYEMVLALAKIVVSGSEVALPEPVAIVPNMPGKDEPRVSAADDDRVRKRYQQIISGVLKADSQFRLATVCYQRFRAMVYRLEANAANPDFWSGIVLPA